MDNNAQRIPSLDGIRAIAIVLVLYWHYGFLDSDFAGTGVDWGSLGVFIFFVLSGFLITTILKRERERSGTISLKNFYIRRVFRIFPPLLFFLAGVTVLRKFGLAQVSYRQILYSLAFLRNYYRGPFRILHHLWSLSVEEQFYLVWPFLFWAMPERKASRFLTAVIVAVPLIRVGTLHWLGYTPDWHTEAVADGLAIGCLLALKQKELRANRAYQWLSQSYVALLLPLIMVAGVYLNSAVFYEGPGKTATFISVALGMDIVMLRWDSAAGKLLNWGPLAALGKLSYSLYLWQQVFLLVHRGEQPYAWFPMNMALAFAAAVISYYCVEQPAIRFGRDLIVRRAKKTSSHGPVPEDAKSPRMLHRSTKHQAM